MNFDEVIDRCGTHCMKWDMMEKLYGVPTDSGIAMWVADMDFRPPEAALSAVRKMLDYGIFGYFGNDRAYREAIQWWMETRHCWTVDPEWIFSTHGLVNGTALCIDAFTSPGDGVVLFTPVYHAFARVIRAAGRKIIELPLANRDGRYEMDFDFYDRMMAGGERMIILCSPHNPGGRVWTADELREVASFCKKHDLILVSDEIHHDLVLPGHKHVAMPLAAPDVLDRLIMLTATTKTFNLAGSHIGNVIVPNPALRDAFQTRMAALGISPNSFGMFIAEAVYSPEGAEWLDNLMPYIDVNREIFDAAMNAIPGVSSMLLEATYLSWVDFRGTGLTPAECTRRIEETAKIAANHGETFGMGGSGFLRFNIATPLSVLREAIARIESAFNDLK